MNRETYEKFSERYHEEKVEINRNLQTLNLNSSNLETDIQKALHFSSKLNTVWDSSPVKQKETLQNFIFPEGICYDTKNEVVLTSKANPFFEHIAVLKRVLRDDTNDKGTNNGALSCSVGTTGFEPAASCTPCKRATGLRYVPN